MRIDYEFETRPEDGETQSVGDGIQWLRMPLPFSLNHINLWLLRDGPGWVIVDTGVGDDATLAVWDRVFDEAMRGDPATHVVATHLHPDHVGCAGYLAGHFDVDLWMSRDEYLLCRILVADTGRKPPAEGVRFYRAAGLDDEQLEQYQRAFGFFGRFVTPLPEAYRRLVDGDAVKFGDRRWNVIVGRGHSPEHACLYDPTENVLIAGDQLLPTISPNVSVWPTEPFANPLADWFDALRKLRAQVPEDVLVLPAHGKPFRGAWPRLDALVAEHERRLERLLDRCREPRRVVDTFPALYRATIDNKNRIMAVGEALAHLHYLIGTGQMRREERGGVSWYRTN